MKKPYRKDMHGVRNGKLEVVGFSHIDPNNGAVWDCKCDCGGETKVPVSHLREGFTESCGCLRLERLRESITSHGQWGTPLYRRWASMLGRCRDAGNSTYGGKGITVDERWYKFEAFLEDMQEGFSENLEIDRIDVTKGYGPDNCRWVDHSENNYNKNKQQNNTSGKTGVNFRPKYGNYRAYITKDGKQVHLGVFNTLEEATNARRQAELEIFGYNRP